MSTSSEIKSILKVDYCTSSAAKFACCRWHYSKTMPMPPTVHLGVWERDVFIGCVLFSRGNAPCLLKSYGLKQTEGCELTRIALRDHENSVSRIVSVALRFLKKSNPGLKLVVSFADPMQGHLGGVYKAGGWVYTGVSAPSEIYIDKSGRQWHSRQVSASGYNKQFGKMAKCVKKSDCEIIKVPGKHRYLMPLDTETRKRILTLSQSYPTAPEA